VAKRSEGQVDVSSLRRSCRISGEYSGTHRAPPLARHDKLTRERVAREATKWVQLNWGFGQPPVSSPRTAFRPGGSQGGYGGVCGISSYLSHGCGPLDLRIGS
jgi:hypothetical protein